MRHLLPCAALFLVVGCSDTSSPTRPTDPAASSEHAKPSMSGAEKSRGTVSIFFGPDPNTLLIAVVGLDEGFTLADWCANDFVNSPNDHFLGILPPSGGFLAGNAGGRDAPVQVLQWEGGPITDICQAVGSPVVATGTADYGAHVLAPQSGVLVLSWVVRGTVELVEGGQARLFATFHVHVNSDGTLLFDKERVTLTPL